MFGNGQLISAKDNLGQLTSANGQQCLKAHQTGYTSCSVWVLIEIIYWAAGSIYIGR